MSNAGLQRGTRAWLVAMSTYHAGDEDVVALCLELEKAWDQLEEIKRDGKGTGNTDDSAGNSGNSGGTDDEWSSGG